MAIYYRDMLKYHLYAVLNMSTALKARKITFPDL